jgi:hypothetical protein
MKFLRYPIFLAFLFPVLGFAQNRFEKEMMRDIALLNEQVRTIQRTLDEKLSNLQLLLQQNQDNISKLHNSMAVMESGIRDRLREQEKTVAAPVAVLGSKVDQMSNDFLGVKESIADLNRQMSRLQTQLVDISNAVKTLSAPPPTASRGRIVTPSGGSERSPTIMPTTRRPPTRTRARAPGRASSAKAGGTS